MLALSPTLFSAFRWPLDEPTGHDQPPPYIHTPKENSDQSFLPQHLAAYGDSPTNKKIFHNASERDRRKKMNTLYSTLRSLLPATDQTKKLSIPNTILHALKYIPELEREVKSLVQHKEKLMSKISRPQEDLFDFEKPRKSALGRALPSITTSQLGETEVSIQICMLKSNQNALSDVLMSLQEEDQLLHMNASCFQSFGERVFYNIHLEGKGAQRVVLENLREKLLSLCEKKE